MDSNKRHTRINFEALGRLKPLSQAVTHHDPPVKEKRVPGNLPVLDRGAVAVTKRARSPRTDNVDSAAVLKHPKLLTTLNSRTKAFRTVKHESPWKTYEKNYDFRLFVDDDRVIVAEVRDPWSYDVPLAEPPNPLPFVVTVRSFPAYEAEEKLRMLKRIQHENIVSVREIFSCEESFHVIFEHMPICLSHFAGMLKYITEPQLASILGQGSSDVCILSAM
jgi:hypothetical protein